MQGWSGECLESSKQRKAFPDEAAANKSGTGRRDFLSKQPHLPVDDARIAARMRRRGFRGRRDDHLRVNFATNGDDDDEDDDDDDEDDDDGRTHDERRLSLENLGQNLAKLKEVPKKSLGRKDQISSAPTSRKSDAGS